MGAEKTPGREPRQVEAFEPLPGDLLRGGRERRGWTREQAARALNLDVAAVTALEGNRFEDLGAPVFAKGHLMKYARVLGLDTEDVARAYRAHVGVEAGPVMSTSLAAPVAAAPGEGSSRMPWAVLLLALALGAGGIVVWKILANGRPPTPDQAGAEVVMAPTLPEMKTETPPPRVEQQPPAVNQPAGGVPVEQGTAGPVPSAPAAGALEIVFEGDSWVEVRDDSGERLLYELGRAGTVRRLEGNAPFRVVLGDATAVGLRLDGEPVPVPPEVRAGSRAAFEVWREDGEIVVSREPGNE